MPKMQNHFHTKNTSDGLFVVEIDYIDSYLAAYALVSGLETVYILDKKHFSRLEGDFLYAAITPTGFGN